MSESTKSTRRLIGEWRAGTNREEVFEALFKRYYGPISHFFRRRGFSNSGSDDLTQQTFWRAYRWMGNYRGEASLETWLFTIATNVWISEIRRRSRVKRQATETSLEDSLLRAEPSTERDVGAETDEETHFETPIFSTDDQGQLQAVLAQERVQLLRTALEELPSQMRRCLELRLYQDLPYREIAQVMQISIQTVRSHLSQARARLREKLAGSFPDFGFE